jgi:long-subunit acyl-CoA synthetase (AMP-forming)
MQIIKEVFSNLSSWGNHPALIEPVEHGSSLILSADQLLTRIFDLSRALQDWGIGANKTVLLFLESSVDFVVFFLALMNVKAVPVPVKPESRTMELEEIVRNSRPQAVVSEKSLQPRVLELCGRSTIITRQRGKFSLLHSAPAVDSPVELGSDTVSVNYTYRGYGYPLGALLPEQQYMHGARVVQDELSGRPGDVMMILLPLAHIFPMVCGLFLCLLYRITAVVARTLHPRLIFQYISRYRVNYMTAVPEIYELLWKCRNMAFDLSSLKLPFSGGSRLSDELYHNFRKDFGVCLAHGYGLTEFTPISRNSANHNRVGTVGPICRGVHVRIDEPSSEGYGEILFQTEGMARGYLKRPEETRSVFCNGWFRTGDIGRIDNGHLVFLGERKNTRKVNGNMVDLEEVRRAILRCGGIADCRVDIREGILQADIKPEANHDFQDEVLQIRQFLKQNLSSYKVPRRFGQLT